LSSFAGQKKEGGEGSLLRLKPFLRQTS